MTKKFTLMNEIKKGSNGTVRSATHEIKYNPILSDEDVDNILNEFSGGNSLIPDQLSDFIYYSIENIIDQIDMVILNFQSEHLLGEKEYYHFIINNHKVHSVHSAAESKQLVLDYATSILKTEFEQNTPDLKKLLIEKNIFFRDGDEVYNQPFNSVW